MLPRRPERQRAIIFRRRWIRSTLRGIEAAAAASIAPIKPLGTPSNRLRIVNSMWITRNIFS